MMKILKNYRQMRYTDNRYDGKLYCKFDDCLKDRLHDLGITKTKQTINELLIKNDDKKPLNLIK